MHRLALLTAGLLAFLTPSATAAFQAPQTSSDSYTRYELQAPGSAAFRILYDVSATTAGARYYFNTIRVGAEEEVHGVTDLHTGRLLEWDLVDGAEARRTGHPRASLDGRYIRVRLARPVPEGGEGRVRIDKTYIDPESYLTEGDEIVFTRSLGIRRNSVVLPPGFELVGVNHPSQVALEADGRVRVSFMGPGPEAVAYVVRGRRLSEQGAAELAAPSLPAAASPPGDEPALVQDEARTARLAYHAPERAFQDREIVYFLQQPETHAFRLYHDYTEIRPQVDRYLNVVRAGSSVSDPAATNLDTGEELPVETLRGQEVVDAGILPAESVSDDTEVVVIRFTPPVEGGSVRLRIHETYTDAGRYTEHGPDLVWDRSFGRTRNDVVLPEGWMLTESSLPTVVFREPDGRMRLTFENPRPDGLQVFLRARHRDGRTQARSLSGEALFAQGGFEEEIAGADAALRAAPDDVDLLVAAGRERRNAWLYLDAIGLYSRAIELAPDDWRPWRYRGHRYISTRQFPQAVSDLERARELAPHSFDVAYHLGLAYYLEGRFGDAADEYGRCWAMARDPAAAERATRQPLGEGLRTCLDAATHDDTRVALADWLWRSLRRSGRDAEAEAVLATITPDMQVDANRAYHSALLVYGGLGSERDVLADPDYRLETVGYGLAVWHQVEGRTERARALMEQVAAHPHWPGFGRIAAEADLARGSG